MSPKPQQDSAAPPVPPRSLGTPKTSGVYVAQEDPARRGIDTSDPNRLSRADAPIELRMATSAPGASAAYEVWTERTVYALDAGLRCIAVREIQTGAVPSEHPCLGALLIAGRRTGRDAVDMSAPLPAAGHRAIFGSAEGAVTITSPVTRVVMTLSQSTHARRPGR